MEWLTHALLYFLLLLIIKMRSTYPLKLIMQFQENDKMKSSQLLHWFFQMKMEKKVLYLVCYNHMFGKSLQMIYLHLLKY